MLDYKIVEKEPFKLIAKVEKFQNEIVNDDNNHEIRDFWNKSGKEGVFEELRRHSKEREVYGACAPVSKESRYFEYGIGMVYDESDVPAGYRIWEVKPTLWAVFPCIGENGDCIGETWDRVYKEFLPGTDYDILDDVDLELYPEKSGGNIFCEIWVPVIKK